MGRGGGREKGEEERVAKGHPRKASHLSSKKEIEEEEETNTRNLFMKSPIFIRRGTKLVTIPFFENCVREMM